MVGVVVYVGKWGINLDSGACGINIFVIFAFVDVEVERDVDLRVDMSMVKCLSMVKVCGKMCSNIGDGYYSKKCRVFHEVVVVCKVIGMEECVSEDLTHSMRSDLFLGRRLWE